MASTKNEDKKANERNAFRHLARAVGWPDDLNLIESRDEPEPDILYRHPKEGFIAFELVRICSEDVAQNIARTGDISGVYMRPSDPTDRILKHKFSKNYTTSHPIELYCYRTASISPDDVVCSAVKRVADAHDSNFRRIWIYGDKVWVYQNGSVVAHSR